MSVSSWRTPAARQIAASSRDDTIEFAKTQSGESGSTPPAAPRDSTCDSQQRADLVAAQHPPPARPGHRDGAAVGVGVVGDDDVG